MEIQAVKLELMRLILNTNNPNILNEMLSAAKSRKRFFWSY